MSSRALARLVLLPALLLTAPATVSPAARPSVETATPIEHLVVIYQENTSFDAYFGVYPAAQNPAGSPPFTARPGTPSVNGLSGPLLLFNPNGSNPFRISRLDSYTCGTGHKYHDQIGARNGGLMNMYLEFGAEGPGQPPQFCHMNSEGKWDTDMGYFDGNTVTALWSYAQYFAMNDNSYATFVGESARGAQSLARGDAADALCAPANGNDTGRIYVPDGATLPPCNGPADSTDIDAPSNGPGGVTGVLVDDVDPFWDVCSEPGDTTAFDARNIGNLLTDANLRWGWFQDGFTLDAEGNCTSEHSLEAWEAATGMSVPPLIDYQAHFNPFQYVQSTANPMHLPPSSVANVGYDDDANHLYDLSFFWQALDRGNLPAVTFLKAASYQTGHPGQSDSLDEQVFIVQILNRLQQMPQWSRTAVIIAWDDSDSRYDHQMPPIVNTSATSEDDGLCGAETQGAGTRCAYGPRLPFLVVSPLARENYVSGVLTDQSSIIRFIEDNWLNGERVSETSLDNKAGSILDMFDFSPESQQQAQRAPRRLFLNPQTGEPALVYPRPPPRPRRFFRRR